MVRGLVVRFLAGFVVAVVLGLSAAAALATFVRWRSEPRDPLTRAAMAADAGRLRTLLGVAGPRAASEQVNSFGAAGFTPLDWAARQGRVEAIRLLLAAGAEVDLHDRGPNGWTALMHALHKGQFQAAAALLAAGADPNARARRGVTPLMLVAGDGNPALVAMLLAAGADPRAENGGTTALTNAVAEGDPEVVRLLLRAAPDVRLHDTFQDHAAVWLARLRGRTAALRLVGETEKTEEEPGRGGAAPPPQQPAQPVREARR
jgi:hypothetical protein